MILKKMKEVNKEKVIPVESEDAKLFKEISESIEKILVEKQCGLQPFLQYTENGIKAAVRIIKAPKQNEVIKA